MGITPAKIMFVVILSFEEALLWAHQYYNCYKQVLRKFVILRSIGTITVKSKETRAVIYTCRYSSGQFISL